MNTEPSTNVKALIIIFACVFFVSTIACNSKSEKSGSTTYEEKPVTTEVKPETTDTTSKSSPTVDASSGEGPATGGQNVTKEIGTTAEDVKPVVKPTPKICSPSFNLVGKPKSNR